MDRVQLRMGNLGKEAMTKMMTFRQKMMLTLLVNLRVNSLRKIKKISNIINTLRPKKLKIYTKI